MDEVRSDMERELFSALNAGAEIVRKEAALFVDEVAVALEAAVTAVELDPENALLQQALLELRLLHVDAIKMHLKCINSQADLVTARIERLVEIQQDSTAS